MTYRDIEGLHNQKKYFRNDTKGCSVVPCASKDAQIHFAQYN